MPSFSKEVWIDVELDEFDDDELVEEIEDRGYTVTKNSDLVDTKDQSDIDSIVWLLSLNKTEEALIQLERMFPELKGIANKIKSAGVV